MSSPRCNRPMATGGHFATIHAAGTTSCAAIVTSLLHRVDRAPGSGRADLRHRIHSSSDGASRCWMRTASWSSVRQVSIVVSSPYLLS